MQARRTQSTMFVERTFDNFLCCVCLYTLLRALNLYSLFRCVTNSAISYGWLHESRRPSLASLCGSKRLSVIEFKRRSSLSSLDHFGDESGSRPHSLLIHVSRLCLAPLSATPDQLCDDAVADVHHSQQRTHWDAALI